MSHTAAPSIAGNAAPSSAPPFASPNAPLHPGAYPGPYPSDEQILGIEDDALSSDDVTLSGAQRSEAVPAGRQGSASLSPNRSTMDGSAAASRRSFVANNAPQDDNGIAEGARQGTHQSAPPAEIPDWLARASAAVPEAAPQLATLWQRASALDTFDRAYYGADASAQQALVAQLYADDPAALRAMVAAAQQIMDGRANGNAHSNSRLTNYPTSPEAPASGRTEFSSTGAAPRREPGGYEREPNGANANTSANANASPNARPNAQSNASANTQTSSAPRFDPAAYAQFEQSTNDAVVADVNRAIERALDRALPGNIADGARRRIAGDTLAEVHAALRGDRDLAAQVAQMLRGDAGGASPSLSARFDSATRDAVARLIATRARGVVPEAARRVIGEWTGSVLASHRERSAKTQASSARVDVTGGALPAPVPRRAVAPREINYRATSDEDILSW